MRSILDNAAAEALKRDRDAASTARVYEAFTPFFRFAWFVFIAWVLEHHLSTLDSIAITVAFMFTLHALRARRTEQK